MIFLPALLGVSAAALLVITGYIIGAKHGSRAREQLRQQNQQQAEELLHVRERLLVYNDSSAGAATLREDVKTLVQALARQGDTVQQMLEPLARRDAEVENLRGLVQHVVTPLAQHERLAFELENLQAKSGQEGGLRQLLDQIAERGHFWAVALSGEEGLPLATSGNAKDLDRLTAVASLALLFADRISRDGAPAPLSLMMHDEANMATLCRIFQVGGQRLLLTAVATGAHLSLTALDPALSKVDTVLSRRVDQ